MSEATNSYLVRAMRLEADGVMSVDLESLGGVATPEWAPGAHLDLAIPDGSIRQFSLCGTPGERILRIAVRREENGRGGSDWIHDVLRPAQEVEVRGPRNHFALEDAPSYLFVAGGIGITPILPMVEQLAEAGHRWNLLYFGRSLATMPFREHLTRHADRVRLLPGDRPNRPDLTTLLAQEPDLLGDGGLVYACGPDRLLSSVQKILDGLGRGKDLRMEYFAAPEIDDEQEPGSFSVRLVRSKSELFVPADRSVLGVLVDAGHDILSDCEEGICGTCETRVLAGDIEHRDYVLTDEEKQAGDCMMVCVSRAHSRELVLDL